MNKYGFTDKEWNETLSIFKKHKEIEEVVLFGSRAKNTFKPMSDVDIVLFGNKITYSIIASLQSDFEDSQIPYFFDIIAYKTITSEELKEHIRIYGKTIMSGYENIPEGWVETTLGQLVKVGRGSSPRPIHNYLCDNGIPWVKIADATASNNKYIEKTKQFIIEEGRSTSVKSGDLIVSNSATPGIPKIMAINACVHDGWLVFDDYKNIDKLYLYYFFLFFRRKLNHSASGSVFLNLKTDIVRNINILLPAIIEEQKSIAKILTAFDDKIENLQAQNKTLEDIGQTIFKEWFGKYKIGDELPEGWRVGKLSEIADFLNGLALQKYLPILGEETLPVIKIRELKQGITKNTDKANIHLDKKYIVNNGDVLFSWSGSLEVVIWKFGKGALNQHLFKVTSSNYPKWFYYFWTLLHLKEFKNVAASKATTMGHINRRHLDDAIVFIPNLKTMELVGNNLSSILDKSENNNYQIQTLKKTRDTLLPKLMSGEIRVTIN